MHHTRRVHGGLHGLQKPGAAGREQRQLRHGQRNDLQGLTHTHFVGKYAAAGAGGGGGVWKWGRGGGEATETSGSIRNRSTHTEHHPQPGMHTTQNGQWEGMCVGGARGATATHRATGTQSRRGGASTEAHKGKRRCDMTTGQPSAAATHRQGRSCGGGSIDADRLYGFMYAQGGAAPTAPAPAPAPAPVPVPLGPPRDSSGTVSHKGLDRVGNAPGPCPTEARSSTSRMMGSTASPCASLSSRACIQCSACQGVEGEGRGVGARA